MPEENKEPLQDVFATLDQEARRLLQAAVPEPDRQLWLFEDLADYNSQRKKNPKNKSGLTLSQELFAQLVARGYSKLEAYRAAYPACKTTNLRTLYPKASRLAALGNVGARIDELKKRVAERALMSTTELYERLGDLARNGGKEEIRLAALEKIGRIHGVYQAEKGLPGTHENPLNITLGYAREEEHA